MAALLFLLGAVAPARGVPADTQAMLDRAEAVKTTGFAEFDRLLAQLHKDMPALPSSQQWHVRYLDAWRAAYVGDYATATRLADAVRQRSDDPVLRFRAGATLVNMLGLSHRYEAAYERLGQVLDEWPAVTDRYARFQVASEASQLYTGGGQYDLAVRYADLMSEQLQGGNAACKAGVFRVMALYRGGSLDTIDREFRRVLDTCVQNHEGLLANVVRADMANLAIDRGRSGDAVRLLRPHLDELREEHYPHLTSRVYALLARANLDAGRVGLARERATTAIATAVPDEYWQSLAQAYDVLYRIARRQHDYPAALGWHEKYMAADKGHLDDVSARAIAYQMTRQRVQARQAEVEALNRRLQILSLEQQLDHKQMEATRLYVVLLLLLVVVGGFWVFQLKRSQARFRRLAHNDGLTGLYNRRWFMDSAEKHLRGHRRKPPMASLLLIDLDHFKAVNDTYGHAVGDLVLRRVAAICQCHLQAKDILGRLGGEEFAVLMPGCDRAGALARGEALRLAIAQPPAEGDEICIGTSASIGVATTEDSGPDLRCLLRDADGALYRAKRAGRNRVEGAGAAVCEPLPA